VARRKEQHTFLHFEEMQMHLRIALIVFSIASLLAFSAADAQKFPSKPVRIIVAAPPGTSPDLVARLVASKLSDHLGSPGIVDNRPGGGGIPAANVAISAVADGYTLLMADTGMYAILPHQNPDFDPWKRLVPITLAGTSPLFLAVGAGLNVSSVKELVALAKSKPGLPYGSAGNGGAHHLFMELLKSVAGIDMMHIAYKGAAPAVQALLSGDVAAAFSANILFPLAKAGKLKILAVASDHRLALMPDIPTMSEAGIAAFDAHPLTYGFFAPLGTPGEIVDRLRTALAGTFKDAEVVQRFEAMGIEPPVDTSSERFSATIFRERQRYGQMIKSLGIEMKP
jgi:tripartite-type tricarboxylate transporter receptor subunit TctC